MYINRIIEKNINEDINFINMSYNYFRKIFKRYNKY